MTRRLSEVGIKFDGDSTRTLKLLRQLKTRTAKVRAYLTQLAAEQVLAGVVSRIPTTPEWKSYRSSLVVARVVGAPTGIDMFAIKADTKSRRVRPVEVPRTVLYIRGRKKMARKKPEIEVLERFSPWTLETIPFTPSRRHAMIISQKVSPREVVKIGWQRNRDRSKWKGELARCGFREKKNNSRLKIPKRVKAIPDVAFEALKLEFGLGGAKGRAHWRPTLMRFARAELKQMVTRRKELQATFTNPGYTGWTRWPLPMKSRVTLREAQRFEGFQKQLGLKLPR